MEKKVLVVDDSALMRRVISDIINADSLLSVEGTASNGQDALNLLLQGKKFDLVLVDINMPKMDGVQFIKEMNKFQIRVPVLVVSSIASESANETIEALENGAFDFVKKPNGTLGQDTDDFKKHLLLRAYLACGLSIDSYNVSKENKKEFVPKQKEVVVPKQGAIAKKKTKARIVFIASSTGGPKALQSVVPYFPAGFAYPIVIVQHMPAGFTASLANRLNEMSPLHVKEAQDGDVLEPGMVYIAQGGKQCEIVEQKNGLFSLAITDKPARGGLKPCADIFLESLVETSINHCVFGVLTGMGADACKGIQLVKQYKEVKVVAQDEDTCVVYGMPRAVAEAGVVNQVVPLEEVANAMIKQLGV